MVLFTGLHGLFFVKNLLPIDVPSNIRAELVSSTWRIFLVGFLYVFIVTLGAVFLSHRAVGPVHRLEEEIRNLSVSNGDVPPLKVREGDGLESLVQAINGLIGRIHKL